MGNLTSSFTGNPDQSHNPLPALEELTREITLNPLKAKAVLECLDSNEKDQEQDQKEEGTVKHRKLEEKFVFPPLPFLY